MQNRPLQLAACLSLFFTIAIALIPPVLADRQIMLATKGSPGRLVKTITKYHFETKDLEKAIGLGSGLTLARNSKRHREDRGHTAFEFWALSDRGPNIEGPLVMLKDELRPSKIFPKPEYGPRLVRIAVTQDKGPQRRIEIIEQLILKDPQSQPMSGLPAPDESDRLLEIPLSKNFELIKKPSFGIDSEGVAVALDGGFWIVDEYRPALMYFNEHGVLGKMFTPRSGLPSWLRHARPNRGFEGVAVLPDGSLVVALQSPRTDEKNQSLNHLDIIKLAPDGTSYKEYRYNVPQEFISEAGDFKIGDLVAVSNESVLATVAWKKQAYVEQLSLGTASEVRSERLLDLRALGWNKKKTEGLALLPNRKTLVIMNDDDFEVAGLVSINPASLIRLNDGSLKTRDKVAVTVLDKKHGGSGPEIWFIELEDKI